VRSFQGEIMVALSEKIPMPSSIVLLETLAARRAILFIYELRFCGSIFEGDSAISINATKSCCIFHLVILLKTPYKVFLFLILPDKVVL